MTKLLMIDMEGKIWEWLLCNHVVSQIEDNKKYQADLRKLGFIPIEKIRL